MGTKYLLLFGVSIVAGFAVAGAGHAYACQCRDADGCDIMACNQFGVECDAGLYDDSLGEDADSGEEGRLPSGSCAVKETQTYPGLPCHYNQGTCGGPDLGDDCTG